MSHSRLLVLLPLLAASACREPPVTADTFAPFAMSGVVEGFYGPPWSHADRLALIRFMGHVGLEHYFYAPKEDPYHRTEWRSPYPDVEGGQLRELIHVADSAGVTFWFAMSPGLSMQYGSDEDYASLVAKIDDVADRGGRHFALFVDDVDPVLEDPDDADRFSSLAAAHAFLGNRLHRDLADRGFAFAITPTTYTGAWGDRDYLRELGSALDSTIPLFWTGNDVASPTITEEDAREWHELIGRSPLLWDNYPVNDYARWRVFLGPFRGRSAGLGSVTHGLIANPMNEPYASMLPLGTLAEFARNPAEYDPDAAWARTAEMLLPSSVALLEPLLDLFGSYGWEDHPFDPIYFTHDTIPAEDLERRLNELDQALDALSASETEYANALASEIRPFGQAARRRLRALGTDGSYGESGNLLVYRSDRDRFVAGPSAPVAVDGDLSEWSSDGWHNLKTSSSRALNARVAFRHDSDSLYVALQVDGPVGPARTGVGIVEGDHVQILIDATPAGAPFPQQDLQLLLGAAGANESFSATMHFEGFMGKWLRDNESTTLGEFLLDTFAAPSDPLPYRSRRVADGYHSELSVPMAGRGALRLSLTVFGRATGSRRVASLAGRNYPLNPSTYTTVVLEP